MSIFKKRTGYISDQVDVRDVLIGDVLGSSEIASVVSLNVAAIAVKDQSFTSSCVGQSVANAVRTAYLAAGTDCPDLSALFAYFCSRKQHQERVVDMGTHVRMCIKGAQKVGLASERSWGFSVLRRNRSPKFAAFADAHKRRGIRGYYRISSGDTRGMRAAISAGFPIVAGWTFSEGIFTYRRGFLSEGEGPVYHAVYLDGFDSTGFDGQNSWGYGWGMGGRFRMSNVLAGKAIDAWAIDVRP